MSEQRDQGPVVRIFTKLLANNDVKILILKYGNTLIFFCWKDVSSKNINAFENTLPTTVNEFVMNELVKLTMLCTTGSR